MTPISYVRERGMEGRKRIPGNGSTTFSPTFMGFRIIALAEVCFSQALHITAFFSLDD
jgi:hypothetical protein